MTPSRRSLLATATAGITLSLAGCTASADDGAPDKDDLSVSGLGASDVYHDAVLYPNTDIFALLPFSNAEYVLELSYDDGAAYDPIEHEVLVMAGHDTIGDGDRPDLTNAPEDPRVVVELPAERVTDGAMYRVVSKDPAGVVDEFELTIHVDGGAP